MPKDDHVRKAHDDLVLLIDYLRAEKTLYPDQMAMSNTELADALDSGVMRRLKQALGVVQGGNTDVSTCT